MSGNGDPQSPHLSERVPYTPQICGFLAESLSETVEKLRGWGIRVLDFSRLQQEAALLKEVSVQGEFPNDHERLRLIGRALSDAQEFRYIVACLPAERIAQLAQEIQHAVGGSLSRGELVRTAYQYQTQFWAGAVIALAGLTPIIPTASDQPRPDFYIRNGTIHYGIEVKRPSSIRGAKKAVYEAAAQLRAARVGGAVIVDVSDCIPSVMTEAVEVLATGEQSRTAVAEFRVIAKELEELTFDEERRRPRPKFQPATLLLTFASTFHWDLSDLSRAHFFKYAHFLAVSRSQGRTLEYHRTQWMQQKLTDGIIAAGHQITYE